MRFPKNLTTATLDHPIADRVFQVASILLGVILAAITVGAVIGWGTIPLSSVITVLLLDALYAYATWSTITRIFRTSLKKSIFP
jgi:hypothetical protein